jgi:hypothetical protein
LCKQNLNKLHVTYRQCYARLSLEDETSKIHNPQRRTNMKLKFTHLAALGLSATLVAGYVGAQTSNTPNQTTPESAQQGCFEETGRRFRHGREYGVGYDGVAFHGFGFRPVALDTQMTFSFYEADPATGATPTETLNFTYGVDSEVAFAEQFQTARSAATFMKVDISEQNRTIDLSTVDTSRGSLPQIWGRGGLNDGSTLTATFYDEDPKNGGAVLQTLIFTQGESSAAGFADDFTTAAATATFVKITTSPQTTTINLSAMPQRREGFGPSMEQQGQGFGPGGGSHHGMPGHGFRQGQRFDYFR